MAAGRPLNLSDVPAPRSQEMPTRPIADTSGRVEAVEKAVAQLSVTKANASTVGGLATAVSFKASQSSVDTLATTVSGKANQTALTALAASVPSPSTASPLPEKVGAAAGSQDKAFSMADHQHPRLTSTTYATLGVGGQATVAFSRTFVNKPGLNMTETDATAAAQPLVMRGLAWVRDGNGLYTGVVIMGSRAQMLPTLTPLGGVLTLLSQVVSGVNGLVSSLTGYNVFGGSTVGATVSVIAVARSDVSAA